MFDLNKPMYGQSAMGQSIMPGDQPYNRPGAGIGDVTNGQMPQVLQQAKKPGAFGKDGWAWKVLGALGDGLQTAGGGHATYMPAMLDMQQRADEERKWQSQLAQQAAFEQQKLQATANAPTADERLLNASANWTPDQWARHAALHPSTVMGPDGPQLVDPRAMLQTLGVGQANAAPLSASDWDNAKPVGTPSGPAAPTRASGTISQAEFLNLRRAMGPDKALNYIRSQNIAIGN